MASGIVVIDKPVAWTSMDVCAKLRGIFHEKRIGHAGTLDPMATGVLPVFVGRATKAISLAEDSEKEYRAGLRLGLETDTQDTSGRTLQTAAPAGRDALQAILGNFRGEIRQIPPMYSAVKIGGKKLYELARKGLEVKREARTVTIFSLELLEELENCSTEGDFLLQVRCSKGTYIRTLCHDIGRALGCGGCMSSLVRTRACGFSISEAVPLETVVQAPNPTAFLRPVDSLFSDKPALTVDAKNKERLHHGAALTMPHVPDGCYRVYGPDGDFCVLAAVDKGRLSIKKNFLEG